MPAARIRLLVADRRFGSSKAGRHRTGWIGSCLESGRAGCLHSVITMRHLWRSDHPQLAAVTVPSTSLASRHLGLPGPFMSVRSTWATRQCQAPSAPCYLRGFLFIHCVECVPVCTHRFHNKHRPNKANLTASVPFCNIGLILPAGFVIVNLI